MLVACRATTFSITEKQTAYGESELRLDLNSRTSVHAVRASLPVAVRGRFENEDARETAAQVDGRI
jgi:hypothetical protein